MNVIQAKNSFASLLETIYTAAEDPDAWPTVLGRVADHIGAEGALLIRQSKLSDDPIDCGGHVEEASPDVLIGG